MSSYKEVIDEQRRKLSPNIRWWPLYLYHFTDIHNAVSIIKGEYIYGRKTASEKGLMTTENASVNVINITDETVTEYVRLYMRPKTPTQYYNEGHKPEHIRKQDLNANCPIPVFFFLDARKTLSMDGIKFVEKGLASHSIESKKFLSGPESFSTLNFSKIFHDGYHEPGSDIIQYKHTEVIRKVGIPISEIIRGVVCRSIAEKQTLLYLLKNNARNKYAKYKKIIRFKPSIDVFYNNGIFIRKVRFEDGIFYFELNDSERRYNKTNANGKDIDVEITIDWLGQNQQILSRNVGRAVIDYGHANLVTYRPKNEVIANNVHIKVTFDGCLMYQNILNIGKFEIV